MTEWIADTIALLGGIGGLGGICSFFLFYRENKRAKQLENEHKANDEVWALVEKYKKENDDLKKEFNETLDKKDNKIESLFKEKGELMKRNDKLSSTVAALTILRCKVVGCAKREPPMGARENTRGAEEQTENTEKQE